MRRLLFAVSLSLSATPTIAQDGIPAAPDIILAVADGLVELRGMIATCAPETVLPDDEASWAAMTDAVAAALWRGGQDPALVAAVTGRLSAVPPPADCTIAAFRFSVVSSAMPEYGGWPRIAARMFENIGLPVPVPLPDRDRLDAVTVAAMSAVEPFRLSLTCGLLLAPEYAGRLARRLTENTSLLAAALTDSGYAPEDVASLVTLTTPAALSDIGTRDRAAVQADCLAREPEWRRNFQFPPPEGLPEPVAQILAAP